MELKCDNGVILFDYLEIMKIMVFWISKALVV
jgi:hypothetical protein